MGRAALWAAVTLVLGGCAVDGAATGDDRTPAGDTAADTVDSRTWQGGGTATAAGMRGVVRDAFGQGIRDAKIEIESRDQPPKGIPEIDFRTSGGGYYELSNLELGAYAITFSADGFTTKVVDIELDSVGYLDVDVTLER